jgi:Methylamine utilisation protein MauE.
MNRTPNSESIREQSARRPTPDAFGSRQLNVEVSAGAVTSNRKSQTSNILWRILDFVAAGTFVYAGALKAFDPVQFASDIDNYKILPWPVSVALAFYLPWLEIFCALGLVFRFLYRGALSILTASIVVFTLATIAAKVRGLDITCGCFGHASQHWSFPSHLATNLAILGGLLALLFKATSGIRRQRAV